MLLHQEIGNMQDVIALRFFEKEISESSSDLFITAYNDVNVLSVYSNITKDLLAYKVLGKFELNGDNWFNSNFNKKVFMDFNPAFSFIPRKLIFSEADTAVGDEEIEIEHVKLPDHLHYSKGLLRYHAFQKHDSVYVYQTADTYSIFVFQGKNCVFANSFNCADENELLYFILNAIELNGMSQERTSLFVDYSLFHNQYLVDFLKPYFSSCSPLRLEHADIDTKIPFLPEMLFPNYLMSLCG